MTTENSREPLIVIVAAGGQVLTDLRMFQRSIPLFDSEEAAEQYIELNDLAPARPLDIGKLIEKEIVENARTIQR